MKKLEIEAVLFKNKLDPIASVGEFVVNNTLNWSDYSILELKVPNYIEKVHYAAYDEFKKKRYIVAGNIRYVIEEIQVVANEKNKIKSITAYSLEKILEKRNIEFESIPYKLNDICDLVEKKSGWKVNVMEEIEESDVTYQIEGKYKIITFLRETLEEAYNVHCEFDTINNIIKIYSKRSNEYGLYADYDNLIEEVEIEDEGEVITRLINDTDISIAEQHITNEEYIDDFSYLINEENVSDDLKEALKNYDLFLKSKADSFTKLRVEMDKLENQYMIIENDITINENLVKSKREDQKGYDSSSDEYKKLQTEIDNLENKTIPGLETDLENKQSEIDSKSKEFTGLGASVSKENSNCFTEEELKELNELIVEEEFNDSKIDSQTLFACMNNEIKDLNAPKISYRLNAKTVNKIVEDLGEDILKLGSIFYFGSNVGLEDLRFIKYRIDYENNTIDNLEFATNKDTKENKLDFFSNILDENSKVKNKVNKVVVEVKRVNEGLETKVSKGDFSSYRIQTYNMIKEKISAGDVESIVTQNADSWNLSINGKLNSIHYKFDENGFQIGSNSQGDTAIHTQSYSMWKHSTDGYSKADATGFYRNGRLYHTCLAIGTGISGGSAGAFPKTVTVQLPDEFKGKQFKVIANMVDTRGGEHLEYVKRIYLETSNLNYTSGTFQVTGYWTSIEPTNNTENEKELQWSYIAVG